MRVTKCQKFFFTLKSSVILHATWTEMNIQSFESVIQMQDLYNCPPIVKSSMHIVDDPETLCLPIYAREYFAGLLLETLSKIVMAANS